MLGNVCEVDDAAELAETVEPDRSGVDQAGSASSYNDIAYFRVNVMISLIQRNINVTTTRLYFFQ